MSTALSEACAALRELFVSLVKAGFSEGQACQIVGTYVANTLAIGKGEEE